MFLTAYFLCFYFGSDTSIRTFLQNFPQAVRNLAAGSAKK